MMDSAPKEGVVIFSLGSVANTSTMPLEIKVRGLVFCEHSAPSGWLLRGLVLHGSHFSVLAPP